jgi:hypothetical protein
MLLSILQDVETILSLLPEFEKLSHVTVTAADGSAQLDRLQVSRSIECMLLRSNMSLRS